MTTDLGPVVPEPQAVRACGKKQIAADRRHQDVLLWDAGAAWCIGTACLYANLAVASLTTPWILTTKICIEIL